MRRGHATVAIGSLIIALSLVLSPAVAEKRVALVIGNGAYKNATKLANPPNDAKAISGMLQSAGFDEVALYENLGIREMRRAISDFAALTRDANIAVVYYSGHGIEVNGVNYLVPIDAVLDQDIDVPYETFSLDNLVQVLEPARRLRLVMLDACRDNPFARSMKRSIGTRAVSRGLAAVEPTSVNTLIGFAAKAGSYALDGEGTNSPYATALLDNLATPGLDLRIAFGRVRDDVLKTTRNRQEPFVYGSLGGGIVSIADAIGSTASTPQAQPQPSVPPIDRAERAWAVIQNSTSIAVIEDFIRQFGTTPYGSMARARLEELRKNQVAAAPPPEVKSTSPPTNDSAERAWATIKDTTSVAIMEEFVRQFGSTPYGSMARARLEELKANQTAAVPESAPILRGMIPGNYGAIAYSPSDTDFGYSYKYSSQTQAERRALRECGKKDCQIVALYSNGCGALASDDDGKWGSAISLDEQHARALAIAQCKKNGGKNCTLVTSQCSR